MCFPFSHRRRVCVVCSLPALLATGVVATGVARQPCRSSPLPVRRSPYRITNAKISTSMRTISGTCKHISGNFFIHRYFFSCFRHPNSKTKKCRFRRSYIHLRLNKSRALKHLATRGLVGYHHCHHCHHHHRHSTVPICYRPSKRESGSFGLKAHGRARRRSRTLGRFAFVIWCFTYKIKSHFSPAPPPTPPPLPPSPHLGRVIEHIENMC